MTEGFPSQLAPSRLMSSGTWCVPAHMQAGPQPCPRPLLKQKCNPSEKSKISGGQTQWESSVAGPWSARLRGPPPLPHQWSSSIQKAGPKQSLPSQTPGWHRPSSWPPTTEMGAMRRRGEAGLPRQPRGSGGGQQLPRKSHSLSLREEPPVSMWPLPLPSGLGPLGPTRM